MNPASHAKAELLIKSERAMARLACTNNKSAGPSSPRLHNRMAYQLGTNAYAYPRWIYCDVHNLTGRILRTAQKHHSDSRLSTNDECTARAEIRPNAHFVWVRQEQKVQRGVER